MPMDHNDEPTTVASRPVEHDDESTSFDSRPWGAQQRLLPDQRFSRTSGPLQSGSVAAIPALVKRPAHTIAKRLSRAPSQRIEFAPAPAAAPPMYRAAPAMSRAVAVPAMYQAAPAFYPVGPSLVQAARASASAFADYIDATLRVRRTPLTKRSLIAAPIGAVLAAIVIALVSLGSSSSPRVAGSLHRMSADETAVALVMPAAPMPTAAAIVEQRDAEPVAEPVAAPAAKPAPKRAHKKKAHRKPRKIVADTSTPLGGLRVRRF